MEGFARVLLVVLVEPNWSLLSTRPECDSHFGARRKHGADTSRDRYNGG